MLKRRLTFFSLPPCSLCYPMRRTEALCSAQVNTSIPHANRTRRIRHRSSHDLTRRTRLWDGRIRHDTSWMTVNTRVMFRISVLFPHANPHHNHTSAVCCFRHLATCHILPCGAISRHHIPRQTQTRFRILLRVIAHDQQSSHPPLPYPLRSHQASTAPPHLPALVV